MLPRFLENVDIIVNNYSMADTVYKKLKVAILTGNLKPRERLVETDLGSKLKVNRSEVRKAIQELAQKGFVELIPNKGARVIDVSNDELEDIYRVRLHLELLAAEFLVKRITREKLASLKRIQNDYAKAVARGIFTQMILKNEEFHRKLYRATENKFLCDFLEKITNVIFPLRYNAYFLLGIAPKSVEQHEAIIRSLEEKNLKELKHTIKESIIYPKMFYLSKKLQSS